MSLTCRVGDRWLRLCGDVQGADSVLAACAVGLRVSAADGNRLVRGQACPACRCLGGSGEVRTPVEVPIAAGNASFHARLLWANAEGLVGSFRRALRCAETARLR